MTKIEITTTHRYDQNVSVDTETVNFDHYIQNCDQDIYLASGGSDCTPESRCAALSRTTNHSNGSVQIEARIAEETS